MLVQDKSQIRQKILPAVWRGCVSLITIFLLNERFDNMLRKLLYCRRINVYAPVAQLDRATDF